MRFAGNGARRSFAISPRGYASFGSYFPPSENHGAGNAGRPMRSQPCVQARKHASELPRVSETPGILRAMALMAYFVSPMTGLFCHRHFRELPSRKLSASVGPPGPLQLRRRRPQRHQRPPHPAPGPRRSRDAPQRRRDQTAISLLLPSPSRQAKLPKIRNRSCRSIWLAQAGRWNCRLAIVPQPPA